MLKKSPEINSIELEENMTVNQDVRQSVLSKTEEMLAVMKNNEAMTQEILKSIRFIKNYFFWQSAFNILKFLVLAGVIILGIISWNTIQDFITIGMNSYIGTKVPGTIDPGTLNNLFR